MDDKATALPCPVAVCCSLLRPLITSLCAAVPAQIDDHNSTAYIFANYYLFDQGGYSLRELLKRADVVDVDAVQADVNRTVNGVINDFKSKFVLKQQVGVFLRHGRNDCMLSTVSCIATSNHNRNTRVC